MPKNQVYTFESHFHFSDCDPAGIFYFGNVSNLCHRTYENWLVKLNSDWGFWFNNPEWAMPIKNSHIDYLAPMRAGETFSLQLTIAQMSQSSFTTHFLALDPKTNTNYFKAQMVHVFVQKSTFTKCSIPQTIRPLFESFLAQQV